MTNFVIRPFRGTSKCFYYNFFMECCSVPSKAGRYFGNLVDGRPILTGFRPMPSRSARNFLILRGNPGMLVHSSVAMETCFGQLRLYLEYRDS